MQNRDKKIIIIMKKKNTGQTLTNAARRMSNERLSLKV